MDFFGNLSEIISEKGKEAAETAKKMAELAGLKGRERLKDYRLESAICYEGK